ncbi:MAG: SMC-Scp complex subunit ScpB [Methylomonas sp.]
MNSAKKESSTFSSLNPTPILTSEFESPVENAELDIIEDVVPLKPRAKRKPKGKSIETVYLPAPRRKVSRLPKQRLTDQSWSAVVAINDVIESVEEISEAIENHQIPSQQRRISRLPSCLVDKNGWMYQAPVVIETVEPVIEIVGVVEQSPVSTFRKAVRLSSQLCNRQGWRHYPTNLVVRHRCPRLPAMLASKHDWRYSAVSVNLTLEQSVTPSPTTLNQPTTECDVNIKRIVEAMLFAANRPMSIKQIQETFPEWQQPNSADIQDALRSIAEDYQDRPVGLKQLASGYRFQVKEGMANWVTRLFEEKPARYSRALLETVAIIAYRQPVTRGEIEEIRGVSVSTSIVQTLLEREWVRVIAHKEVPGRPALYGTTKQFLDYFNLTSLSELPALMEIADLDFGNATQQQPEQELRERSQTDPFENLESKQTGQSESSPEQQDQQTTSVYPTKGDTLH